VESLDSRDQTFGVSFLSRGAWMQKRSGPRRRNLLQAFRQAHPASGLARGEPCLIQILRPSEDLTPTVAAAQRRWKSAAPRPVRWLTFHWDGPPTRWRGGGVNCGGNGFCLLSQPPEINPSSLPT